MMKEKKPFLAHVRHWYDRLERPISSISLVGGFVFDAVTLERVDLFWENLWVVAHIAIVTICVVIINAIENTDSDETDPRKAHFWLVNIMQFFFGGIFSTFLVFYFRSGSIVSSWPFLAILAAAFIANERLKRHYARLTFQIALLFLSFYAFAIYLMPILLHTINAAVFLLSGAVSIGAIWALLYVLKKVSRERFAGKRKWLAWTAIFGIVIAINTLYFENLIPPLPLSLKDAGIYESLTVKGPGHYVVQEEPSSPFAFFEWSPKILITPGASLYAYTAVFSPTALDTNILHVWQYYDAARRAWITRGRIPLAVNGGADGGWRTYSVVPQVTPGSWRVEVETTRGQIIGEIRFTVETTSTLPSSFLHSHAL